MDEDKHNNERQAFSYRSGYAAGKRNTDGTLTPLNRDELRAEAARFRRGAAFAGELWAHANAARQRRPHALRRRPTTWIGEQIKGPSRRYPRRHK